MYEVIREKLGEISVAGSKNPKEVGATKLFVYHTFAQGSSTGRSSLSR